MHRSDGLDAPANTISEGVKNDIYRNRLLCGRNSSAVLGVFIMKIGDRCFCRNANYVEFTLTQTIIAAWRNGERRRNEGIKTMSILRWGSYQRIEMD